MPTLELRLLGPIQATHGGVDLNKIPNDKVRMRGKTLALFYRLAIGKDLLNKEQVRNAMFETDHKDAETGVRRIRSDLGVLNLDEHVHLDDSHFVFNTELDYALDVEQFERLARLQPADALDLYRGPLLQDLSLVKRPIGLHRWLREQRLVYHERAMALLAQRLWRVPADEVDGLAQRGLLWLHQIERYENEDTKLPAIVRTKRATQKIVLHSLLGDWDAVESVYRDLEQREIALTPELSTLFNNHVSTRTARREALLSAWLPEKDLPFVKVLPPLPELFVGRDDAIAHVSTALADVGRVCVVGMGGVGKTTLTTVMMHHRLDRYPDGVLRADLSGETRLNDYLSYWVRDYRYDYQNIPDNELVLLFSKLIRGRRLLIVLDDVDPERKGWRALRRDIKTIFKDNPHAHLLLTTRNKSIAAHLKPEVPIVLVDLHPLARTDSVALLLESTGTERSAISVDAAAKLAQRAEDLPLALDFMGKNATNYDYTLDHQALLLEAKGLMVPEDDQEELDDLYDLTWDLLNENIQRCYQAASLFGTRSFTVRALTAILKEHQHASVDPSTILLTTDYVKKLVANSLINRVAETDRFQFHALLADYAARKAALLSADQHDLWRTRMLNHYYEYLAGYHDEMDLLQPELAHIMHCIDLAATSDEHAYIIDMALLLSDAWFMLGRLDDADATARRALTHAQALGDEDAIARLRLELGRVAVQQGRWDEAQAILNASLEHYERAEEGFGIAQTLHQLGNLAVVQGKFEAAEELLQQCIYLYNDIDDEIDAIECWFGIVEAYYLRVDLPFHKAEYSTISQYYEITFSLLDRIPASVRRERVIAEWHRVMGDVHRRQNDLEASESALSLALQIYEELGDQSGIDDVCYSWAITCRMKGEYKRALGLIETSINISQRRDDPRSLAWEHRERSNILRRMEYFEEALRDIQTSCEIAEVLQLPQIGYILLDKARIYKSLGQLREMCKYVAIAENHLQHRLSEDYEPLYQRLKRACDDFKQE